MPYGDDESQASTATAQYSRNSAAAQRFQYAQEDRPIQQALEVAKLRSAQAALEFQGRAELHTEQTQHDIYTQGSAFYAALPAFKQYLNTKVSQGNTGFSPGGADYQSAWATFGSQFPAALAHLPKIADAVDIESRTASVQSRLNDLNALTIHPGQKVETNAQSQPIVSSGAPLDEQTIQRYSRVQGILANAQTRKIGEMARQLKADPSANYNPSDPLANPIEGEIRGAKTELGLLEKNLPSLGSTQTPAGATSTKQTVTPAATPGATPAPLVTPTPAPTPAATPLPHQAAIDWAKSNPGDPRSKKILDINQSGQ